MPPPREDFDIARDWELSEKEAFTLAEVLITLGVVGVVAAMTMPSLISNVQATINKNKFKKALNTLNQAVTMAYAKEEINFANTNIPCDGSIVGAVTSVNSTKSTLGGPDNSFCSIFNSTIDNGQFLGSIQNVYKGKNALQFSSLEVHSQLHDLIGYELKDGIIFAFDKTAVDCYKGNYSYPPMIYSLGSLSGISSQYNRQYGNGYNCYGFIDINGTKGPNKLVNAKGNAFISNYDWKKYSPKDIEVTDIFPIVFYDGVVAPGTEPVKRLLQTK